MNKQEICSRLEENIDALADLEHQRWAHWQSYLHIQCESQPDGSLLIPKALVQRWERQIETSYVNLTENEKESDREQVREFIPLVSEILVD